MERISMKTSDQRRDLPFSTLDLGVVCPMANERKNAERFIKEVLVICLGFPFKRVTFFPVLDLASQDGTLDLVRRLERQVPEVKFIFAPENRCVVDAYFRGYEIAMNSGCDWILEMDAGYSHQPCEIAGLFNTMIKGYDCVFGSRFCKGGRFSDTFILRYVVSRGGTLLTNFLLGTRMADMTGGFELFTRGALKQILRRGIRSRGPFFQTEIRVRAHDFRVAEVPIHYRSGNHPLGIKDFLDAFCGLWHLFRFRETHSPLS